MKQGNRVLQRIGARELTSDEVGQITGAINTLTIVCTIPHPTYPTTDNDHEGC
jgi:hypothetical protein